MSDVTPDERLAELGIELPDPPEVGGNYVPAVRHGNLLYLSGHGPLLPDGKYVRGKVGADLDVEAGYNAARLVGITLLGAIRDQLGSLDRVDRIVKLFGMVNCTPDFNKHPPVINGASDLFVEVFGERGRHARSAVGMSSLPFDIAVEIEAIVAVSD